MQPLIFSYSLSTYKSKSPLGIGRHSNVLILKLLWNETLPKVACRRHGEALLHKFFRMIVHKIWLVGGIFMLYCFRSWRCIYSSKRQTIYGTSKPIPIGPLMFEHGISWFFMGNGQGSESTNETTYAEEIFMAYEGNGKIQPSKSHSKICISLTI